MIYNRKNFSLNPNPSEIESGDTFYHCNWSQHTPNTAICIGKTGLTFEGCMLTNCNVPQDAELIDCKEIQISRCSNLHPEFVERGLTECVENCSHVIDTDTVEIDGVVVDTIYHYKDTRL